MKLRCSIYRLFLSLVTSFLMIQQMIPQSADSLSAAVGTAANLPVLVPPATYVVCGPTEGGTEASPAPLTLAEAMQLSINFRRDQLPPDCGVQFLSVTISIYNKQHVLQDKIVKHAFTFPLSRTGETDASVLMKLAKQIVPFGFVSERKINSVQILNDTVAPWSLIKVEVTPDDEYTKFAERLRFKMEWWYRITGPQIEEEFFLGIPKVLYDTRADDTVTYGNASAMLRFYYLNAETGARFPVNLGIGTFGVSTPIDVSSAGGGFAVSLLFDVVQAARLMYHLDVTHKFNAGIEITPYFPLEKKSRILLNARIGYSP